MVSLLNNWLLEKGLKQYTCTSSREQYVKTNMASILPHLFICIFQKKKFKNSSDIGCTCMYNAHVASPLTNIAFQQVNQKLLSPTIDFHCEIIYVYHNLQCNIAFYLYDSSYLARWG